MAQGSVTLGNHSYTPFNLENPHQLTLESTLKEKEMVRTIITINLKPKPKPKLVNLFYYYEPKNLPF